MFQFPLPAHHMMPPLERRVGIPVVEPPQLLKPRSSVRTLVDNCLVELVASLFINLATLLCWPNNQQPSEADDRLLQFVPPLTLGLVLLCIKDEDYFFPDGAPTVTLVMWILGGYNWHHMASRLLGHTIGFALALWIGTAVDLPPLVHRVEHAHTAVFALELVGTLIEHLAVVFVLLPLLPPAHAHESQQQGFAFPKVKLKSHQDTQPPPNHAVMHAALTFAALHWCLWRGFCVDMSPITTLLVAILRTLRPTAAMSVQAIWDVAIMALWGQFVGFCLCMLFAALYMPRETKLWAARNLKH